MMQRIGVRGPFPGDESHRSTDQDSTVLLVSTFTVDRLPIGSSGLHREIPGGPARYIGEALTRLRVPYRILTGERAIVEVVRDGDGEEYIIPALPLIPLPRRLVGDAVILSPIMREIDPCQVPPVDGILIVDVQGFVREPARPTGNAGGSYDLSALLQRSDVVKASTIELERLTRHSLEALEDTILLRTDGRQGAYVTVGRHETFIPAHLVETANAIGAGDTFLAAFITELLSGVTPVTAAERAARFTEKILSERTATLDVK